MTLPSLLLESLAGIPGFDEQAFVAAHQKPAPVSVRVHPIKGGDLWQHLPEVPWCSNAHFLPERPVFTLDPSFQAGCYYVQEASSMFLQFCWQQVIGKQDNLRILDLCAAPGGKSTLLASIISENSLLISNDVIRSRATILEENMTRWGYTNTWVSSNDPREFGRSLPGYFDAMVIDAPCSGSGLFRKDNAAINEWSEDAVNLCSARQQRIIADVWDALKPNGYLFYATCSYSPAEDEQILDWINDNYPTHSVAIDIPSEWGIVATQSPKHKATGYRFSPDKVTGEGFFIAILQKTEASSNTFFYPRIKNAHSKKAEELSRFLLTNEKAFSIIENDRKEFTAIYPQHQPDWHLLTNALYLRKAGILLGEPAQKDWIPAHDVALAIDKSKELEIINLSEQAALHFLKKENFDCPMLNKGWHIVGYNNQGLGWIKSLSNRVNNYLPKHWRIRMELPNDNSE